jgi:hypothetical protein
MKVGILALAIVSLASGAARAESSNDCTVKVEGGACKSAGHPGAALARAADPSCKPLTVRAYDVCRILNPNAGGRECYGPQGKLNTCVGLKQTLDEEERQGQLERGDVQARADERKRLQDEAAEVVAIGARFGALSTAPWYADASEDDLNSVDANVSTAMARLAVIAADLGQDRQPDSVTAPIAASTAGIPQRVATERACRASTSCMADRAAKKAEVVFYETVVTPMCAADKSRDLARADIARERANPSGTVDRTVLHADGLAIQTAQKSFADLTPRYAKTRRHAWRGWKSECP